MTQQHPITPPPTELVQQWVDAYFGGKISQSNFHLDLATRAAQWGADQELEACRMEIIDGAGLFYIDETSDRVRLTEDIWIARRPKPPSLKEQALEALDEEQADLSIQNYKLIRAVLESLPDHE
jgi:hypothetical protein